ncbi:MAG: HD domain-containing protein [Alphaproteobacteria bacterium]|nr:HD domain-containing protein [Alphaproteobacteria bacterium]
MPRFAFPRHRALWADIAALLPTTDLAHDADHILRVYAWALRLAPELGADVELAGAAALVHDLVNIPKDSPDRPLGSEASAEASRGHLATAGYDAAEVAAVVEAVRTCSWSRGLPPTTPLGAVLQDADRLDAIGAVGLARNLACAQTFAPRSPTRFYDPADPLGTSGRTLDDVRNAADHLPRKLLKLAATMHSEAARAEARQRHAFLQAYLGQLQREAAAAAEWAAE